MATPAGRSGEISCCLFTFPVTVYYSALRIGLYLFHTKKVIAQFKTREKMIGHHTRLRENDDLSLCGAPAVKNKKKQKAAIF